MKHFYRIIASIVIFILGNYYSLDSKLNNLFLVFIFGTIFLCINIIPSLGNTKLKSKRLRICGNGCELLILFCITTVIDIIYSLLGFMGIFNNLSIVAEPKIWIINSVIVIAIQNIIFWNGIIRVYLTSIQLGVKMRVIGILCGMIPIANIIALMFIIRIASDEVEFENEKIILNQSRKDKMICKTKYPILLVHGVFFRDFSHLNYWGRIPNELEENGAQLFYGNHESAASVENSAKELLIRIKEILRETGAEKVNIIAHSKGGLDTRYLIKMLGADKYVASLTTINTPHRGCEFADYLLYKIPKSKKDFIANSYNSAAKKLGDKNPDFISAVTDLTALECQKRNEIVVDCSNVYYQSVGSKLNASYGGKFPLNFSYHLVKFFDGPNDGLVGEKSFRWGSNYKFLTVNGKRGISHGDVIDLNRENIKDFDVREFYVQLVHDLKCKGF